MRHPETFGRYQVVDQIGRGGMATVYLAWDPTLERKVAIKVLIEDNPELRERFSREARSAARLRHPHIVTMYDVGEYSGQPFMAMEFVEGQNLAELIRNRPPLPLSRRLEIASELADGLAYAHARGVVHRDIKPANVMLDGVGALKILDFGIARVTETAGMTQTGVPIGTFNYMSPEQLAGRPVDQRSDIFSYGALLFELLSYRQAFPGSIDTGLLHRVLTGQRDPIQNVCTNLPAEVVRIVDRLLEPDLTYRYQSMDAALEDLRRAQEQVGPSNIDVTVVATPMPEAPARPPVTPRAPTPRRTVDLGDLARRRAKQIQESLQAARDALAAGDLDAGIAACEGVLLLDPDEPTAIALLDEARAAVDERQAEEMLQQAERELQRGALAAALATIERAELLAPASPRAVQLRRAAEEAQRERDRQRARADAIRQAVARSHAHFDKGRFAEAVQAADEALALDGTLEEALTVKRRASEAIEIEAREAIAREARTAVRDARRRFAENDHAGAIEALEGFTPAHEIVTRALEQLRAEAARIAEQQRLEAERLAEQRRLEAERLAEERRREAARLAEEQRLEAERQAELRRREAEARARLERIAAGLAEARDDMGREDHVAAIERLETLAETEGSTPEIAALRVQATEALAAQERAQQRADEIAEHVARAAGLFARKDLNGALARIDAALALEPAHGAALVWQTRIQEAIALDRQRREAEQRHAREQAAALANALATADRATAHEDAIAVLEQALNIDPEHQEVRERLAFHRDAHEREQEQRRQLAAEETARREEIRVVAEEGRRALDDDNLFGARAALGRLQVLDPRHQVTLDLARELASVEAAARRAPAETPDDAHRPDAAWAVDATWTAIPSATPNIKGPSPAPATPSAAAAGPPPVPASTPVPASVTVRQPAPGSGSTKTVAVRPAAYVWLAAIVALVVAGGVLTYVVLGRSTPTTAPGATPAATTGPSDQTPVNEAPAVSTGSGPGGLPVQSGNGPVGGTVPPDVPPPAPPETTSPPPAATANAQLTALIQSARGQYANGARPQALESISAGLKLQPENPELRDLLDRGLRDARAEYAAARSSAVSAGAERSDEFASAERQAQNANRLTARAASVEGIRAFWNANEAMKRAVTAAAAAAAARQARTPATTATPPAATQAPPPVERPVVTPVPPPTTPSASTQVAGQNQPSVAPPVTPTPAPSAATPPVATPDPTTTRTPEPTTVAPATPRAPATQATNEQAIRAVVAAYAAAYSRLDAGAVRAVFPDVDFAALQRTFSRMKSQRVQFEGEQIQINGTTATVSGTWQAVFELAAGAPQRSSPRVVLTLRRSGDSWVIVDRR